MNDASEQRALEARLTHLEKMESIGRLAGGIAHDFNNLLTAILGYTELLLGDRPAEDPDRPALEEIQRAGQRAAALTHQLLAFSRKQVLQPQEVDLNRTVLGLQSMLTRLIREDITLHCEVAGEPALVRIDPTQIEQAILNLVLNARDALPAGGWIRLEVARLPASAVAPPPDAQPAAAYVRLRVADNGAGISEEVRPHLFEPFFTTKEQGKGTGLGLASVHGIVHQSQGWIDVTSEPGHGAAFAMHFPAIVAQEPLGTEPAPPVEPVRGHETVLLVEDEEAVRTIIAAVLRRQGYTVIETASPLAACELFDRHGDDIDLLITDVVMPVMNGPALAQRLVAIRPALRVLCISGYAGIPPPEMPNPNFGFLNKPFQSAVLAARVREMLGRPTPAHRRPEDTVASTAKPTRTILIVDDEESVRHFVERVLREAGYQTALAADGQEALEVAKRLGPFDLLVTDMMMPQMTGDELARRLRRDEPKLKILYLTGYSDRLFKDKMTLWEDEAFLDKPCTVKSLKQAVSLLLSGRVDEPVTGAGGAGN